MWWLVFLLTIVQMRARPVWIDHHMSQTERGLLGVTRVDVKLFLSTDRTLVRPC